MTNKRLGQFIFVSYALAFTGVFLGGYAGSAVFEGLGTLAAFVGFFASLWGAYRLLK